MVSSAVNAQSVEDWKSYYEFNYGVNISLTARWIYVETPKCACTTIKRLLAQSATRHLGPYSAYAISADVHSDPAASPHVKPYQLPPPLLNECLFGNDYLRFACIRDPYERLVSAFSDKVLGRAPHAMEFLASCPDGLEVEDLFDRFISYVASVEDPQRDRHWRSQFELLGRGVVRYQHLLSFEHLASDWESLRALIPDLPAMPASSRSAGGLVDRLRVPFGSTVEALYPLDTEEALKSNLSL